jgi:hypothetical protein
MSATSGDVAIVLISSVPLWFRFSISAIIDHFDF